MTIYTFSPSDAMTDMQEAAEKATQGVRDAAAMQKAAEEMDRISEEVRRRQGVLDIGVPAIRELRDR